MDRSDWQTLESLLAKLTPAERRWLAARLQQLPSAVQATPKVEEQQAAWATLFEELKALPIEGPCDGFSGADHDRLLYGDHS